MNNYFNVHIVYQLVIQSPADLKFYNIDFVDKLLITLISYTHFTVHSSAIAHPLISEHRLFGYLRYRIMYISRHLFMSRAYIRLHQQ